MNYFENLELVPEEVIDILDKYAMEDETYENCITMENDLNSLGWTMEWSLDAVPYNLQPIETHPVKSLLWKV